MTTIDEYGQFCDLENYTYEYKESSYTPPPSRILKYHSPYFTKNIMHNDSYAIDVYENAFYDNNEFCFEEKILTESFQTIAKLISFTYRSIYNNITNRISRFSFKYPPR